MLAIIGEDPEAPKGTFIHWLVRDIPCAGFIDDTTNPGMSGTEDAGKTGCHGPCPPAGSHCYYFYVFALNSNLNHEPVVSQETYQMPWNRLSLPGEV